MKVATALIALLTLASAAPSTSDAQVSSLEKRALPAGWSDCGTINDPVQIDTFSVSPYAPKWNDKITISNIQGVVRKSFTATTVSGMVQIGIKTLGGMTYSNWIKTASKCVTFGFLYSCLQAPAPLGSIPAGGSVSFTPSEMLANQPSFQSAFDSGSTISIKIRIINDFDGQQIDCVENPTFVA